jgi:hypothetical protein
MPRFITVGESVIDTGTKAWATDYHKRSDGLYDVRFVVDGFTQSILAFGVESPGAAQREVCRQLLECEPGGLTVGEGTLHRSAIDISDIGTGEQDAPSIIRPDGVDAAKLLKM